jgi:hypothetical protein
MKPATTLITQTSTLCVMFATCAAFPMAALLGGHRPRPGSLTGIKLADLDLCVGVSEVDQKSAKVPCVTVVFIVEKYKGTVRLRMYRMLRDVLIRSEVAVLGSIGCW